MERARRRAKKQQNLGDLRAILILAQQVNEHPEGRAKGAAERLIYAAQQNIAFLERSERLLTGAPAAEKPRTPATESKASPKMLPKTVVKTFLHQRDMDRVVAAMYEKGYAIQSQSGQLSGGLEKASKPYKNWKRLTVVFVLEEQVTRSPEHQGAAPHQTHDDHEETLRSLARLRDEGIISAEEYEAKKVDILARM